MHPRDYLLGRIYPRPRTQCIRVITFSAILASFSASPAGGLGSLGKPNGRFPAVRGGRAGLRLRGGQYVRGNAVEEKEIRKPDVDKRRYRHVVLPNSLECILISDAESHSGAAAMCVGVGQLDDPPGVDGLAHFLEHMLFLGTERYPEESSFDQFCSSCAGYSNAWTSLDHTTYHFIVAHDKLRETLDRFAAFFTCPLFSEGGTEREMHAVDSEHNKNLQDDYRREFQILRATSNPLHPLSRFGSGNLKSLHTVPESLGLDVRQELLNFHKKYYSADVMRLCILGNSGLDEMEGWVHDMFGGVPNCNVGWHKGWTKMRAFGGEEWNRMLVAVPVKERRTVTVMFAAPPVEAEYRSKPQSFLSHLMGHEGPGSILAHLQRLGWATELVAGPGNSFPNESTFSVSVSLTAEGLPFWDRVVSIIFHYLDLVHRSSYSEREALFKEARDTLELNFRYRGKEMEDSYSEAIAYALTWYPPQDALCGSDVYFEPFSRDLSDRIDTILTKHFHPRNMRLLLVSPEGEIPESAMEGGGGEWRTDDWYGAKYWMGDLPLFLQGDVKESVSRYSCNPDGDKLSLPPRNDYVTSPSQCLLLTPPSSQDPHSIPSLLLDSTICKGWHLFDVSFGQPKTSIVLQLNSHLSDTSVAGAASLRLLLEVLELRFNKERYMAQEAGLSVDTTNYSFSSPCAGLRMVLNGYSDKLPMLLRNLMKALLELNIDTEVFEMAKEKAILDYRNRKFQQPFQHSLLSCNQILESPFFSYQDRCAAVEACTLADLQQFKADFLSSTSVEVLMVGNIAATDAKGLMIELEDSFSNSLPQALPQLTISRLEDHVSAVYETECPDPDHVDSAVSLYLQVGPQTHRVDAQLDLLCQMLDKAVYTQLRTQEQLGYIACAEVHVRWGVTGLRIAVQSVKDPKDVTVRIKHLLASFRQHLEELDKDEFEAHVNSTILKKREPDRNLESKCSRIFHEIATRRFEFDRRDRLVEQLRGTSKEMILELFNEHFHEAAPKRRELVSAIVGKAALDERGMGRHGRGETVKVRMGSEEAEQEIGFKGFVSGLDRYSEQP
uniref:Peptidase M16 N-terminal domain-containing protein n=1 Tax=Hemiselmis andersenii TaxID=464988 RepID=A0A7S0UFC5_HEMAN|mmetsp:Transcript_4836/g.11441  ORF Transcript_4836/g.11441 Transcript_4836/m.11441 type:complete len:1062 (+) Transcript_4836:29-3214(+)